MAWLDRLWWKRLTAVGTVQRAFELAPGSHFQPYASRRSPAVRARPLFGSFPQSGSSLGGWVGLSGVLRSPTRVSRLAGKGAPHFGRGVGCRSLSQYETEEAPALLLLHVPSLQSSLIASSLTGCEPLRGYERCLLFVFSCVSCSAHLEGAWSAMVPSLTTMPFATAAAMSSSYRACRPPNSPATQAPITTAVASHQPSASRCSSVICARGKQSGSV